MQRVTIGNLMKKERKLTKMLSDKDRLYKNFRRALRNSKRKVETLRIKINEYAKTHDLCQMSKEQLSSTVDSLTGKNINCQVSIYFK
jgi:hypothetical protein